MGRSASHRKRSPARGRITRGAKRPGERSAGNPHAPFEVAGAGNGPTVIPKRARSRKRRTQPREHLRGTAPALDPTRKSTWNVPATPQDGVS